jgi:hypothetical protein
MGTRRLSENGYFRQSLRQAQIIILEILQCIPVVLIFAFPDLEKNFSFSGSLLVNTECWMEEVRFFIQHQVSSIQHRFGSSN